jgi:two-component system, cell cycle response regulator
VLREFTARISSNLRIGKDWVARLGGEEFAVVFPDTTAKDAGLIAGRLRERIAGARFEGSLAITASFGVCALEHFGPPGLHGLAERMVREADGALYQSKHLGRNRVTACNASFSEVPSEESAANDPSAPHAKLA